MQYSVTSEELAFRSRPQEAMRRDASNGQRGLHINNETSAYLRLVVLPFILIYATVECLVRAVRVNSKIDVTSVSGMASNFMVGFLLHVVGRIKWELYSFRTRHSASFQAENLAGILKRNSQTEYGRKNRFDEIGSVEEFQQTVPVITYADMQGYIERMSVGEGGLLCHEKPLVYATTSGTTAKPKYLPVTRTSIRRGHKLSQLLWMHRLYEDSPEFASGKLLCIVSAAVEGHLPDGTPFGSATGFISKKVPRIMRKKYALPAFTAEISDYTAKYYFILRCALEQDDISYLTAANPSTVALLCQKMQEWAISLIEDIKGGTLRADIAIEEPLRLKAEALFKPNSRRAAQLAEILQTRGELTPQYVWPRLKTLGCWTGGNSGTFLNSIKRYFSDDVSIRDIGYLASELKGSIPLYKNNSAGVLALADTFFEFVEVEHWNNASDWRNVRFLLPHQLEIGKPYYIFVTNNSGLYRYDINDIVQVKSFHNTTPEIVFLQKGKGATNITGEKLYEAQVVSAVESVKKALDLDLYFYLCVANAAERRYDLLVEFVTPKKQDTLHLFANKVDKSLQEINIEYASKRASLRLGSVNVKQIAPGGFARYRAKKIQEGQREGQFKLVILTSDCDIVSHFEYVS